MNKSNSTAPRLISSSDLLEHEIKAQKRRAYRTEWARRWRKQFPEKARARSAKWRKLNPERNLKLTREQYQRNHAARLASARKYYHANRDACVIKARKYRADNITIIKAKNIVSARHGREALKPWYIRQQLAKRTHTGHKSIPDSLVSVQTKLMKLKRLCKQKN